VEGNKKLEGTVVTGVIGEDVHIVGIRILEHALRNAGVKVVSLGAQVSQEEFINAAAEANADAIFVSSFSGHAESLAPRLREKCTEAGLSDIILYIGGYLLIGERPWQETEKTFKKLGFDRVYPPGISPTKAIEDLKVDASLRRRQYGT
jgi:methylaspartate mutase sigma subunit